MGMPFHAAFGVQGVVDSNFKLNRGNPPSISYDVNNDIVFPISIAHRWEAPLLPGKIGVGLTGKYLLRNKVSQKDQNLLVLDDVEVPPFSKGKGIGSDLGFLYQPTDRTNVGLMVQDFLGTKLHFDKTAAKDGFAEQPERDTVIRPRTNLGVAITPKTLFWLLPTGDRWTFAADLRDLSGGDREHVVFEDGFRHVIGEHFYTHTHFGAEFRYWFLRFRGGAYQGYPSLGLGLDLPVLKLDAAYYGRELGPRPGSNRQDNYVISLAIAFGAGNVEARERIAKVKDVQKNKEMAIPSAEPEPTANTSTPYQVDKKEPAKQQTPTAKPAAEPVKPAAEPTGDIPQ
jgi:hypothetical protein